MAKFFCCFIIFSIVILFCDCEEVNHDIQTTVSFKMMKIKETNLFTNTPIYEPFDFKELAFNSEKVLRNSFIEVFVSPFESNFDFENLVFYQQNNQISNHFPQFIHENYKLIEINIGKPFRQIRNSQIPGGYHDPDQLMSSFLQIEAEYPEIAKLIDLTLLYNLPTTTNGRSIYALKISDNVEDDEDEDNVLIVSNHHARELMTPEIALTSAQQLTSSYATNSTIEQIIDNKQIYIIWTLNPDGLNYVWDVDNMWRKNRRDNGDGSHGVDLNRNYEFGWDFSCGGSSIKYSETYKGPSIDSEIEVQTMIAFQADRLFSQMLDYHSYARDVRPNYAECAYLPPDVHSLFITYATNMAKTTDTYSLGQSCCTGGNIGNAYFEHGTFSSLIESGTAFQPPEEEMKLEVNAVWPMTYYFLQLFAPLSGHVFDDNNKPIKAFFDVHEIKWFYGETWYSNPKNGRYSLWLPAGDWTITAYQNGYMNTTQTISVDPTIATEVNFILTPSLYYH